MRDQLIRPFFIAFIFIVLLLQPSIVFSSPWYGEDYEMFLIDGRKSILSTVKNPDSIWVTLIDLDDFQATGDWVYYTLITAVYGVTEEKSSTTYVVRKYKHSCVTAESKQYEKSLMDIFGTQTYIDFKIHKPEITIKNLRVPISRACEGDYSDFLYALGNLHIASLRNISDDIQRYVRAMYYYYITDGELNRNGIVFKVLSEGGIERFDFEAALTIE